MTKRDDDPPRDDSTPASLTKRHPARHRARLMAGLAGVAAVLGGGAYAITSAVVSEEPATTNDVAIQLPTAGPALHRPSDSAGPSPSLSTGSAAAAMAPTADISGSPLPSKIVDEVRKAREKMARDGVEVKRPVVAQPAGPPIKDEDIDQTTTGKIAEGGTVRVVAAEGDLTGQRELSWVAGGITRYRGAECSQTFKFATSPVPTKKPNLLICWRTSPTKSVAALVADIHGKPSKDKAVAALEKKWRSMG